MAGVGEKFFRRRGFEDFPFVHEDDAVSDGAREAHFVRDHQHGDAAVFREFDHHVQHFFDHFRVERRGRFVEEQHFTVHAQGTGGGGAGVFADVGERDAFGLGGNAVAEGIGGGMGAACDGGEEEGEDVVVHGVS